jgi:hypothetical protein
MEPDRLLDRLAECGRFWESLNHPDPFLRSGRDQMRPSSLRGSRFTLNVASLISLVLSGEEWLPARKLGEVS